MNIGVFDSGLGGLTILKKIVKTLPQYNYIYLGDNARVPYGGRSAELIYQFTERAIEFLFKKDCVLIIVACNTASSVALRKIQREYLPKRYPNRRVLGVIRPVVEAVAEKKFSRVGVVGTRATVKSGSFVRELKKLNKQIRVLQKATPLLVPIIEEGELRWKGLELILEKYLSVFKKNTQQALILGCTHYELIEKKIKKQLGKTVVIGESKAVAEKLVDYLKRHPEIEARLEKQGQRQYYFTDANPRFLKLAKFFLRDAELVVDRNFSFVGL